MKTGYTYDANGNVLSCRSTDGTGYDYTYDADGRLLSYRRTNGTGYDYTRDADGRVLSFRHTDSTGHDYTYDADGRLLSFRRTDGTGYDVLADDGAYALKRDLTTRKYTAGCRTDLTLEQALAHWGPPRTDKRAQLFFAALMGEVNNG